MSNVVVLFQPVRQEPQPLTAEQRLSENLRRLHVAIDILILMSPEISIGHPELAARISGALGELRLAGANARDLRRRLDHAHKPRIERERPRSVCGENCRQDHAASLPANDSSVPGRIAWGDGS